MNRLWILAALWVLWMAAMTAAQTPKSEFSLQSEKGDYIGVGQKYFYAGNQTAFAYDDTGDGVVDGVRIFYFTSSNTESSWTLSFSTAQLGKPLTVGLFEDARLFESTEPGHPGLAVFGNFRLCNQVTGRFTVFDARFDTSSRPPKVVSFGVTFEQHCEGAAPALFGTLYFNSTAEPDTQKPVVSNVAISRKKVDRRQDATVTVSWSSSDNLGVVSHDILFADDGKSFSTRVATGLSATAQSFIWTVPASLHKTKTGVVKVTAKDMAGNMGEAVQKGTLKIK